MSNEKTLLDLYYAIGAYIGGRPERQQIPVLLAMDTGGVLALPWSGDFDVSIYGDGEREAVFYPVEAEDAE